MSRLLKTLNKNNDRDNTGSSNITVSGLSAQNGLPTQNSIPTLNGTSTLNGIPTLTGIPTLNSKFNPDVANMYNHASQLRNTTKYTQTNEGYKTIINEKMPTIVKNQDDLKLKYEKSNDKDAMAAVKKMTQLNQEREQEKEKLNKQIDHTKKLEELIKIKRKESTIDYQASTHGELKQMRIAQNDKIKSEKEKFNNIVNSLNDILK